MVTRGTMMRLGIGEKDGVWKVGCADGFETGHGDTHAYLRGTATHRRGFSHSMDVYEAQRAKCEGRYESRGAGKIRDECWTRWRFVGMGGRGEMSALVWRWVVCDSLDGGQRWGFGQGAKMDEGERKGDLCLAEVRRFEREARDGRKRERQRVEKRRRRVSAFCRWQRYVSCTLPLVRLVPARIHMYSRPSIHILHP